MKRDPNIGYRSEDTSAGKYKNLTDIICFELEELQNTDIIDCMISRYFTSDSNDDEATRNILRKIVQSIEEEDFESAPYWPLAIDTALKNISRKVGKDLKYGLWLCDTPEQVMDMGYADDFSSIDAIKKTDVILSDLDEEGKLYAYTADEWTDRYSD